MTSLDASSNPQPDANTNSTADQQKSSMTQSLSAPLVSAGKHPIMSDITTHGIRVGATAFFLPEESHESANQYAFGYRILIHNTSEHTVQLIKRCWRIIDANGKLKVVRGEGVVGETPILEPDEAFKYTSYAVIETPWGTMQGEYGFVDLCKPESSEPTSHNPNQSIGQSIKTSHITESHKFTQQDMQEELLEADDVFKVTIGRFFLTPEIQIDHALNRSRLTSVKPSK